jgi:hypothetical protein
MKKIALLCALALVLSFVQLAAAGESQTVDILISKLEKNFAVKTNWGNIYFNERDLHRLIHGAAYLRPVMLGEFLSDTGSRLMVKTVGYDKGVVTLSMSPK